MGKHATDHHDLTQKQMGPPGGMLTQTHPLLRIFLMPFHTALTVLVNARERFEDSATMRHTPSIHLLKSEKGGCE